MTDEIQFEEDYGDSKFHIRSRKILGEPTTPTMINFLLEKKIVKTEKQALVALSCAIVVFLGLSVSIIHNSLSTNEELIIVNKYGQKIPFDVYVDKLNRGEDPIL